MRTRTREGLCNYTGTERLRCHVPETAGRVEWSCSGKQEQVYSSHNPGTMYITFFKNQILRTRSFVRGALPPGWQQHSRPRLGTGRFAHKALPTLRMQLQPVFHCFSPSTLHPGSGRQIPAICHGTRVWHGHFTPEP